MKLIFTVFYTFLFCGIAYTQNHKLSGRIIDTKDQAPLPMVTVTVSPASDTTNKIYRRTDDQGKFFFDNLTAQEYIVKTEYFGYVPLIRRVSINQPETSLGDLPLSSETTTLKELVIKGTRKPTEQSGDTTILNAGSYKTNPNANAEDLISKMPGMSSQGGNVKAHGEDVKQIFIDGKPFFGEDPSIALKNLPADVISKIQVYDRMSDQSAFTGFDDGQSSKAINIITKPEFRNGTTGRIFTGYGTDDRYIASGNVNYTKNQRQLTLVGLSNNINQQNFSSQDLTGVAGSSSRGQGGPGAGGRGAGGGGRGGNSSQGNNSNNFLVGQQSGISTTNSVGANYADKWGKKMTVSGSYFFNNSRLRNAQSLNRQVFLQKDSSINYAEKNISEVLNNNHRVNFRLEYQFDSSNSLLATPKISYQNNDNSKIFNASNTFQSVLLNKTSTRTNTNTEAINFNNTLLFRHKFAKKGRTFSAGFETDVNDRNSSQTLNSMYQSFQNGEERKDSLVQITNSINSGNTLTTRLNYTEPLAKNHQLQVNYVNQLSSSLSDKKTSSFSPPATTAAEIDSALSNRFENKTTTNRGGLTYRFNKKSLNMAVGAELQHARLEGRQAFPFNAGLSRNFTNVLPNAMLTFNTPTGTSLRVYYRSSANLPSVNQLQNVTDNTNPLQLTRGNSRLSQEFSNNLFIRYSLIKNAGKRSLFAFVRGNYVADFIGNATNIARKDSVISENVFLPRGGQITAPVNLQGYYSLSSFVTYSFSADSIKSKININLGYNYSRTPGLINNRLNLANSNGINLGAVLASNISQKTDFTLSSTASYTFVTNSIRPELNNNYFNLTSTARVNLIFWKDLVFSTESSHNLYRGLSTGFNQSFFLVNAGFGKRIFKNKNGEIKVTVFDLLNQNNSINRTVTESYVEDSRNTVLRRYFMLTFLYNFKKPGKTEK